MRNVCVGERSAAVALVGDARRDQVAGDFAQQVLGQRTGTTKAKALKFDEVFGEAAHGDLSVARGPKRPSGVAWYEAFSCDESIGERLSETNQPLLNLA
ncbi:hypothetical protein AB1286_00945 [Trinickia sp. NRRL B-1857]|uniref:hypothetical protein n=1 Tax=Trinickia sp. NRRL B-1857 TaxID=3162879 RepID=UPI003D2E3FC8